MKYRNANPVVLTEASVRKDLTFEQDFQKRLVTLGCTWGNIKSTLQEAEETDTSVFATPSPQGDHSSHSSPLLQHRVPSLEHSPAQTSLV